jgi:hypothetical protein
MNEFTKEELIRLYGITKIFDGEAIEPLRNKIQSLIDSYCDKLDSEKEIFSCYSGIGISDEYPQGLNAMGLSPAFHELNNKCDGVIKESGIYAIKIKIVKIK